MVGGALYELVDTHAHLEEVEDLDQARVDECDNRFFPRRSSEES